MKWHRNAYMGYSIGCGIVWAVLFAVVSAAADTDTRRKVTLVFSGWWIGWLSATIARAVYPPLEGRERRAAP